VRSRQGPKVTLAVALVVLLGGGLVLGSPQPETPGLQVGFAESDITPTREVFRSLAPERSVDLRPIFKNWGLEPRAQGGRGTCSAFVVTGALEYALADLQRRGTRLSVEFLNWAANEATGRHEDGGYFSDLWKGFAAHGICPEQDLPYRAEFDPALRPSEEALRHAAQARDCGLRLHWIKPWDVTTGLTDAQLEGIKRTLRRQWPVCGGLRWPKRERWTNDVLEMTPPQGVRDGHSVLLVGFRDDPGQGGGGVFIIRNSGTRTGDQFMTYEFARAYMNDAVWIDHGSGRAAAAGAKE